VVRLRGLRDRIGAFAFLVARRLGRVDIRSAGSGNVGAANVWRVAGSGAAMITLMLDMGKGAVPVVLAGAAGLTHGPAQRRASPRFWPRLPGVAAMAWRQGRGHDAGASLAWDPSVAAVAIAVFIVAVLLTRVVSIGSMLSAMTIGPLGLAWGAPEPIVFGAFVAGGLVVCRHRDNLIRLVAGTERRLGAPRTGG